MPKALVLQVCRLKDLLEHRVSAFLLKHVLALKSRSCLCVQLICEDLHLETRKGSFWCRGLDSPLMEGFVKTSAVTAWKLSKGQ